MDDDHPDRRHKIMLVGLLGTVELERLYLTSVHFRSRIDMLALLLPTWIDAMAAEAVTHGERIEREIELAKMTPGTPMLTAEQAKRLLDGKL